MFEKHLDKKWLYAEYWIKRRTAGDIAREVGCSETNIFSLMRRRGIDRRDRKWTKKQIDKILELNAKGKTFKEIADYFKGQKTYDAVRNTCYKILKIKSKYDPAVRNQKTRKKISASLQGINIERWNGFKESDNALVRKSIPYQKWRTSIFKKDDYTCQKCRRKSGGVYLVAHHIANFSKFFDRRMQITNGITLCRECHIMFHNRYGRADNNLEQIKEYL